MAKIKKIIIFNMISFYERDYGRFGIKILQENGFEVEVWDFVPFLYPQVGQNKNVPDPFYFPGFRRFFSYKEVEAAILNLNESCFIVSPLSYGLDTYKIYRAISRKNLRYCICAGGCDFPGLSLTIQEIRKGFAPVELLYKAIKMLYKIYKIINSRKIKYIFENYIFSKISYRFLGIKPANLILTATAKNSHLYYYPIDKSSELLCIHYWDYDVYLDEIKKPFQVNKKMGVFLDEYMSFSIDWVFYNMPSPITPEEYYPCLCNFFDYLENNYGVEIVIAGHPRSQYEKHPDYFGGRKVIRNQTAKLVKEAGFVLAHQSYSTTYAVLFNKPIIFMTTDKMNQTFMKVFSTKIAGALGKQIINLNKPIRIDWDKELSIDDEKYAFYKHSYIKKKGTEELPFWQVVANRIKRF